MAVTNITSDGASGSETWTGGRGTMLIGGTFDKASARIEFSTDSGANWYPVDDEKLDPMTVRWPKAFNFELPACDVRLFIVKAGASTNLSLTIEAL